MHTRDLTTMLMGVALLVASAPDANAQLTITLEPAIAEVAIGDTLDVAVNVDDGHPDVRAFSLSVGFDGAALTPVEVLPGGALTGAACEHFFVWENEGDASDSVRVDAATLGCSFTGPGELFTVRFVAGEGTSEVVCRTASFRDSQNDEIPHACVDGAVTAYATTVGFAPTDGLCLSTANDCAQLGVEISRESAVPIRAFSVKFRILGEMSLCGGLPGIQEGDYLSGAGTTFFQTLANPDGSYSADCAILGSPCGATAATGTLFTVDLAPGGQDGQGTIQIEDLRVRDCVNADVPAVAGDAAVIDVDVTATPVSALDVTRQLTGNDADGTIALVVAPTAPADAANVTIFRKPFGDYPEYDDGTGEVPSVPADPDAALAEGWTATALGAGGGFDEPPTRDYWYFVAFAEDSCGNVSAPSPLGGGATNYHLGDVSNGFQVGQGDNLVEIADVSLLGANYGTLLLPGDPRGYLDIGPTSDGLASGLPLTDDLVDFEDLVILALSYGDVSRSLPAAFRSDERPTLSLGDATRDGGRLRVELRLERNARMVKAAHAAIAFDPDRMALVDVMRGELLEGQGGPVFFLTKESNGRVIVDVAVPGGARVLDGAGVVAELVFAERLAGAQPMLVEQKLRDARNRELGADGTGEPDPGQTPVAFRVIGAVPNPFAAEVAIVFELAGARQTTIRIYDIAGRRIRDLSGGPRAAGRHEVRWDGRDSVGRSVPSGVYFYVIATDDASSTHKLFLAR